MMSYMFHNWLLYNHRDIHIRTSHNSSRIGHHSYNYIPLDRLEENVRVTSERTTEFEVLHRVQSSCHGAQIHVKPSLVSRQIVPSWHGFFEQSSNPMQNKTKAILLGILVRSYRVSNQGPRHCTYPMNTYSSRFSYTTGIHRPTTRVSIVPWCTAGRWLDGQRRRVRFDRTSEERRTGSIGVFRVAEATLGPVARSDTIIRRLFTSITVFIFVRNG